MNKEEIIEAINSTIVTNGQKGITAESLANILIEMASATPEGGGNGSLAVYIPLTADTFGVDVPLTSEQQSHNAEVYAKCLECFNNDVTLPSILFDLSSSYEVMMGKKVKYNEVPSMTIFVSEEFEGIVGLAGECVLGMVVVAEDGSVTIQQMS
jgi:hypothetical protein